MPAFITKFIEQIEVFHKLVGPVFLSFLGVFGGLGYFIYKMYSLNLKNKIEGNFPSQFDIYIFFICAMAAGMIMLVIIMLQTILFEKIKAEQNGTATSPPPTNTDSNTTL